MIETPKSLVRRVVDSHIAVKRVMPTPQCDHLSHRMEQVHDYGEPCPAEQAMIDALEELDNAIQSLARAFK